GGFGRKEDFITGWDWGTRLVSCRIWRQVSLIEFAARIRSVTIHQERQQDWRFRVWSETAVEGNGQLMLSFGEHEVRSRADAIQALDLIIDDPVLWWPNGLGDQRLYEASARLDSGSEVRKRIGL